MTAYYSEFDPYAAQWLRNLIEEGLIAPGDVDERDIRDVQPDDLKGYTQVHLFAGIGGWSAALRLAGWPDSRPVWTGSPPCQPWSAAGKQLGFHDERHLWPVFFDLIRGCNPPVVFGEQVANGIAVGAYRNENVQRLWERQADLRVLKDRLEGIPPEYLQALQERTGPVVCQCQTRVNRDAGEQTRGGGKKPGCGEGPCIRTHDGVGTRASGSRSVRGDGDCLRHDGEEGLEHAVLRQESPYRGLHAEEHQARSVCAEHGLRELGRGQDAKDCLQHIESAKDQVTGAIEHVGGEIEAQTGASWLNALQTDMETAGYACGAVSVAACGVGAPHIRQRLWFVAERLADGLGLGRREGGDDHRGDDRHQPAAGGERCAEGMADGDSLRQQPAAGAGLCPDAEHDSQPYGHSGWLGDGDDAGLEGQSGDVDGARGRADAAGSAAAPGATDGGQPGPTNGFWRAADWLSCRDGKWRPVEPGTFPLAAGVSARVGKLRAYGNAIVPQAAAEIIAAYMEDLPMSK